MKIEAHNCPNCGGRINIERMVCEYCGSTFGTPHSEIGVLRVEHYTSPTRVFAAKTMIPNELHAIAPEQVVPYAQKELAEKLVKCMLEGNAIEFTSEMDWERCQQIISARLRVLDPHYRF